MKVYVLAHTHWDREWFVTSEYTQPLLEGLFESLLELFEEKPDFVYILDGQTLVLEDILSSKPELEPRLKELVSGGNLVIGPVYAQIDWRISPPQAVWKNFSIGVEDSKKFGKIPTFAWFMDNFGHVSQLPQLMRMFGVDWVFLWRGVELETGKEKMFLRWSSPDGSSVNTVFLIGGYRNLYNLSETRDMAKDRLEHEVGKISSFTKVPLLLDGYDLDTHPEDPRDFSDVSIDPRDYMETLERSEEPLRIEGEQISGKYACTFPGTLSTRTYLKIGADHVGRLLTYLSVFEEDEEWMWREYLKTLIHDNIAGVCVDQVHERMENVYRELCKVSRRKLEDVFSKMNLKGMYVFSPASFEYGVVYATPEFSIRFETDGTGIWRIGETWNWEEVKDTGFENEYFVFDFDGKDFRLNGKRIGVLRVEKELGDAYSSYTEPMDFSVVLKNLRFYRSRGSMKVELERSVEFDGGHVRTEETILLDSTPLVRWTLRLFPKGVDYKLRIGREVDSGPIRAGMPFDVVERDSVDTDLLPENLDPPLSTVLLAAREVGKISDFPFQDFVSAGDAYVLAHGLREYTVDDLLWLTLVRSVEWMTKPNVPGRVGDAGPEMYVPGGRCEREIRVELAFMDIDTDPIRWVELFSKVPIVFHSYGEKEENVPLFKIDKRWFLKEKGRIVVLSGKKIETVEVSYVIPSEKRVRVDILTNLSAPFGPDSSRPDPGILKRMKEEISNIEEEIEGIRNVLESLEGLEYHEKKHRLLSLERKRLEMILSLKLNLEDTEIGDLVRELNEARRRRRTYDYVLEFHRSKGVV